MSRFAPTFFDVEPFRRLTQRDAVVRRVAHPTMVLGSTQRSDILSAPRAVAAGVDVVRRRGGGGAVLLRPGDHLWIDAWIPRDDPLWQADVGAAAAWVGAWWVAALGALGLEGCVVHHGRAEPGRLGALVCFSGRGPGEVFKEERKVMGVSQWRSREGALFRACAYTVWDPGPLVALLDLDASTRDEFVTYLRGAAAGIEDLGPAELEVDSLAAALLSSFPTWGIGGRCPSVRAL